MRVAIIGAGAIGQSVGRLLGPAGHDLTVSWASSDARLRLAAEQVGFGARPDTPAAAVEDAKVVLFAPRFEHIAAAGEAAGSLAGEVVIDTTNPYNPQRTGLLDLGDQTAAQFAAARLPGARYVKAFNTLTSGFLAKSAGRTGRDRVAIFVNDDEGDRRRACRRRWIRSGQPGLPGKQCRAGARRRVLRRRVPPRRRFDPHVVVTPTSLRTCCDRRP